MASKRKVGNLLALAVMSYLSQQPMHPYELGRTLREHGDARSIKFNHGSLYMVVGQLAKAGYITELETSREGQRPERTVYALTDAGRAEFSAWLRELVAEPQQEYPHFVAALSLIAALPPGEVVSLLRHRLDLLRQAHTEIRGLIDTTLARGIPELFLVEEEYRLALLVAEIAFVEEFIAKITDNRAGWGAEWARFHDEGTADQSTADQSTADQSTADQSTGDPSSAPLT
jgi:DNA-binding PadR family transcriptional regulator